MTTATLLGATGLVGRELLGQMLADPSISRVTAVARRSTGVGHPKLQEHIVALDEIEQHPSAFVSDVVFCALGTTIKTAGSQEEFRKVDHDYPLRAAKLALTAGARHYLLVSALGADARSRIFYNRVKGEVERDIKALGLAALTIAQPSLLLGPREKQRRGERIAAALAWLTPDKYKPIHARDVAAALIAAAKGSTTGVTTLESRVMRRE